VYRVNRAWYLTPIITLYEEDLFNSNGIMKYITK
jgi:hypothetical protein